MKHGTDDEKEACTTKLQKVLQVIGDLGLCQTTLDSNNGGITQIHKFTRRSLPSKAQQWLHDNRVSLALFGPAEVYSTPAASNHCNPPRPNAPQEIKTDDTADSNQRNNNKRKRDTMESRKQKAEQILLWSPPARCNGGMASDSS